MKNALPLIAAAIVLCGCASRPPAPAPATPAPAGPPATAPVPAQPSQSSLPHYRCDNQTQFDVRFADDTAVLDMGAQGRDVLLRDAGGVTPQQTVFSNSKLRAEFGLGTTGREAILRYLASPQVVRCARQ